MAAFLGVAIIFYLIAKLASDWSTTTNITKQGRDCFMDANEKRIKHTHEYAKKHDYYVSGDWLATLYTDQYGDGSRRYDKETGKPIPRGTQFNEEPTWVRKKK
ncbi:hypothetical protein SDC9_57798 [bioreactor metagenome]|uniref:Uncharacterized protein n=1 Tax=bioreactor metagenome TaxID=1076179 RepID=A0A644XBB6_9ZZZZ